MQDYKTIRVSKPLMQPKTLASHVDSSESSDHRVSNYTIVAHLPDGKYSLILHGITGAFDKVERRLGEWLQENLGNQVQRGELTEEIHEHLTGRGFLTGLTKSSERALFIRISETLHRGDLERKIPSFCFVPTYRCNLRCPYCFQSHAMHKGEGDYGSVITHEQILSAFEIIDRYSVPGALSSSISPGVAGVHATEEIGLFGGEPLMQESFHAIEMISELARARGIRLWGITNGVDLQRFRNLLGNRSGGIRELQITVDGMPHHHNKRRVGPGLRNTFDLILENIQMALDCGVQISIRMNTDSSNLEDILDLGNIFDSREWSKNPLFSFNCAAVTGAKPGISLSRSDLFDATAALRENNTAVSSYENTAAALLLRLTSPQEEFTYPFLSTAHCAAESGQLMFDALGEVYSCWDDVGERDKRIGAYDKDGLHLLPGVLQSWLARHPGAIEQCSECPFGLIHTSGCGAHARDRTGSIFEAECESFQAYFPKSLAAEYVKFEKNLLRN